jgi:myo-inositol-hexaphosphate 3-phosphohydrolase
MTTERTHSTLGRALGPLALALQESDGSHVVSAPLRADYPLGLFVSQDGDNTPPVLDDENFKFTPVHRILEALRLDR